MYLTADGHTDCRPVYAHRLPVASGGLLVGERLPMIGKLLGHTQAQTTARYAHLANDPVKSAANHPMARSPSVPPPIQGPWRSPSAPLGELAAAISGGADVIVTANLRKFPASRLAAQAISAQHPDDFTYDLFQTDP